MQSKFKKPSLELFMEYREKMKEEFPADDEVKLDMKAAMMATVVVNGGSMRQEDLFDTAQEFISDYALLLAVDKGWLKVAGARNGEVLYELTEAGRAHAATILGRTKV